MCCSQCTEHNALSAETTIWFAQNCPQEVFVTCQPMCFNTRNSVFSRLGHGLRLKIRTMDHSLGFTYRIVHMAYLGLRSLNGHWKYLFCEVKALIFTSFGLIQRRDTYLQLTALMAGQKLVTSGAGVEKHSVAPWSGWRTAEAWLSSAFLLYIISDWQFLLARSSQLLFLQKKIIQTRA